MQLDVEGEEGIAQISDQTVGVTRVRGRDDLGRDIEEKFPTRASEYMLDPRGDEMWFPMANGRTIVPEHTGRYAERLRRELIRAGNIPVLDCPYSARYTDLVGGRMVGLRPGEAAPECAGATDCGANDELARPALYFPHPKVAARSQVRWVRPCSHWLEVQARRRAATKGEAAVRREVLRRADREAAEAAANEMARAFTRALNERVDEDAAPAAEPATAEPLSLEAGRSAVKDGRSRLKHGKGEED
jgi:hypothetical protein